MRWVWPALIALSFGHAARGHHDSPTAQLPTMSMNQGLAARSETGASATLLTTLAFQTSSFGRWVEENRTIQEPEAGSVEAYTLSLQTEASLSSSVSLGFTLPMGLLDAGRPGGSAAFGLRDVDLYLTHDLGPVFGFGDSPVSLGLRGGVTAPTGAYAPDEGLAVRQLVTDQRGGLAMATFNTQLSLGAGAWVPSAGLHAAGRISRVARLTLDTSFAQAATATEDQIRWGSDWLSRLALSLGGPDDQLVASPGVVALLHRRDRIPSTEPGQEGALVAVGGRRSLSADLQVGIRVSQETRCFAQGQVPLSQRAGGIQLMETFSASAGCTRRWGG